MRIIWLLLKKHFSSNKVSFLPLSNISVMDWVLKPIVWYIIEWNSFCGTDLVITAITPSEASTAAVVAPTVGAPAPVVVVTTTSVSPTLDLFTDASTTTPYDS